MCPSHGSLPHDRYPADPSEPRLLIPLPDHRDLVPVFCDLNRVDRRNTAEHLKANGSKRVNRSMFNPYVIAQHTTGSVVKGNRNQQEMKPTIQLNGTNEQANRPSNRAWMMYYAPTPMVYAVTASNNFTHQDVAAFDHFQRVAAMGSAARNLETLQGYPSYPFIAQQFDVHHRQLRSCLAEHNPIYMIPGVPQGPGRIPDFIYIQNAFGAGLSHEEGIVVSVDGDVSDSEQEILSSCDIVTSNDEMDEDEDLSSVSVTDTQEM